MNVEGVPDRHRGRSLHPSCTIVKKIKHIFQFMPLKSSNSLNYSTNSSARQDFYHEMKIDKRIPKYAVIGGSLTALLLIMYFLIASAFDFKEIVELRYFNILILSLGIFATQYLFHHHAKERLTNYLNGIALGMGTGLLAGVTFSLFFYGFLKFAAPDFGLVLRPF